MVAFGILELFLGIYYKLEDPIHRIVVWLVYKLFSFGLINIFAKISCYAMRDDFQSLLLVFMMVHKNAIAFLP